jgi:hypothetical protein
MMFGYLTRLARGVSEFGQTRDLPQLIQRLYGLSPHVWSANTQKYFPDELKLLCAQMQAPAQNITREKVRQEFNIL